MFHVINQCKKKKKVHLHLSCVKLVKSDVTVSKSKSSIRCQKQTSNGANIHSLCCKIPENGDPNFYLYTEILDG
jgi:hypothetical protein